MIQKIIKVLTLGFFVSTLTGFVLYRMGYFDASSPSSALQTSPNGGELNSTYQAPDSTQILDSNQTPVIKQQYEHAIMPSSKSTAPVFDLKKYQEKKAKEQRMSSSKSMTFPIDLKLEVEDVKEHYVQPSKSAQTIDQKKIEEKKARELRMYSSKSLIIEDFQPYIENWFSMDSPEAIKVQPELVPKSFKPKAQSDVNIEKQEAQDNFLPSSKSTILPIDPELIANQIKSNPNPKVEVKEPRSIAWGMIGLGVLGILFVGIGSIVYFKKKSK